MTHIDYMLPKEYSKGATGGPTYSTSKAKYQSGRQVSIRNRNSALRKWDIAYGIKTKKEFDVILELFMLCGGMSLSFDFLDWQDYKATNEPMVMVGSGYQYYSLYKYYGKNITSNSALWEARKVWKPVYSPTNPYDRPPSLVVFKNNIPVANSEWYFDWESKVVAFYTPVLSTDVMTASFEFLCKVKFGTDEMLAKHEAHDVLSWPSIPIEEIFE